MILKSKLSWHDPFKLILSTAHKCAYYCIGLYEMTNLIMYGFIWGVLLNSYDAYVLKWKS